MKNYVLAFVLSAIPGFGHFYMNIRLRAALYAFGCFGSLIFGTVLAFILHDGLAFGAGLVFAVLLWIISIIDLVVALLRRVSSHPADEHSALNPDVSDGRDVSVGEERHHNERFLTIFLSFIPGLGHFQLGLMNRGLTLLLSFFGSFAFVAFITFVTHQSGFLVFLGILPVIWLYGIFDAAHLMHRKQSGEVLEDRTVLEDLDRYREAGKRSILLANLLSVMPGAGHLYLGLQKRGIQLMGAFLFSIYFLDQLHFTPLLFIIPLIWFYSFFDALQLVSKYRKGEQLEDAPVATWLVHHQKWVGVGLIVLGVFFIFDRIVIGMLEKMFLWELRLYFNRYVQTLIISILLIFGGIKLMVSSKQKASPSDDRERTLTDGKEGME